MSILYIGDIMGQPGMDIVAKVLPELKKEYKIDFVVAQAENVTDGKSMSPADMRELQAMGIGFFTGGNHTPFNKELHMFLKDEKEPVIGPLNMPSCPGAGYKVAQKNKCNILFVSLLGATVGRKVMTRHPLHEIDTVLEQHNLDDYSAIIVNFHGDYSSEKRIIGYYLDGRVSAVIGDHWHVPTADAMVLPKGTAHITDVGMCGTVHSSLGVELDAVIPRWRDDKMTKNLIATGNPSQFNAVLLSINDSTGLADTITPIQQIIP